LSTKSLRTAKWRGLISLVAVILLAAGIGQTSVGHTVLRQAGLFEEPTGYTSLAFQHPQAPVEQPSSDQTDVAVSFVIHNAGRTPETYQWSVLLIQGSHTSRAAAGSLRLASGQETALTRSAKISCAQGQVRIVISLARPTESIDALTTCRSKRS
jgi:hypothetical protein